MRELNNRIVGNLSCFAAYAIFGFNIISCRSIALDGNITPMALFCLRSFGATALFWLCSLFAAPGEQVEVKDLWKVAVASFLGLFMTQLSFLYSVTKCTAIDVSIMSTLTPIMTLIISAIFIKERITWNGIAGMVVNTLCFASYVGIFKPLIQKYPVVTFMKWMFLFSSLMALPFSFSAFGASDLAAVPMNVMWQVIFVVVAATFIAYFLIPIGQKRLKPVIVCMYTYVQPVIAMAISLAMGMDTLNWLKIIATALVFSGVGLVNFVPKSNVNSHSSDDFQGFDEG